MRNFLKKYKGALILLVLLAVGFWAYIKFFPKISFVLEQTPENVGEELFAALQTLQSIKLDASIFSDADFLKLQDFETAVEPERSGRANPFAPTGGDSGGQIVVPTREVLPVESAESFIQPSATSTPATTTPAQ